MINKIEKSSSDLAKFSELTVDPSSIANDFYDYSRVVVMKPWGQEYLIFENENVAIWILRLKRGAQTSMHCHPNKKTSLVVIDGKVVCSTLEGDYPQSQNGGLMIPKGVFHQTAVPEDAATDAWVMEIESPVNKRDLVRLKDKYGRVGQGYENKSHYSSKLQNYNYLSLNSKLAYHNLQKRFGNSSLGFMRIENANDIEKLMELDALDVISIISGSLLKSDGLPIMEVGDTLSAHEFKKQGPFLFKNPFEVLVIKKMDKVWKVSDYVVSFLKSQNVQDVFLVPGDSNVHLLDSLGKEDSINHFANQNERAASLATEAYSKMKNDLGVLMISSGGCGPNALPGVANAWIDSTPMLIISGQARSDQDFDGRVRQLGNKALNIIEVVKPVTKYAFKVEDAKTLRYHLEKAVYLAKEGRPGPVWIDLPIDLQGMLINADEMPSFVPPSPPSIDNLELKNKILELESLLDKAERPVLIVGNGVRLSGANHELNELLKNFNIPLITTRKGSDLITSENENYFGRSGVFGQRRANFIVQNADLIIGLGARFSIPQIGRATDFYARAAKKVVVDIDLSELEKKTFIPDLPIKSDLKVFLESWIEIRKNKRTERANWLKTCQHWSTIFHPLKEGYAHKHFVSIYLFINELANKLPSHSTLCVDGCTLMNTVMHIFSFKNGQRIIGSTGIELPGFSLAGGIGAKIASENKVVILIEAQAFYNTLAELQTIVENNLSVKIMVFQNNGHSHVRKIQEDHFASRYVGTDTEVKKLSPDIKALCSAYKIPYISLVKGAEVASTLEKIFNDDSTLVCEVVVDPDQELIPRVGFNITDSGKWLAKPLEDMYPYLSKEVLKKEMLVKLVQE